MGIKQSLKSFIGSNTDALHSNMFTKPLMFRPGSGMTASPKQTKAAWDDMRKADKVVGEQKERIADVKSEMKKLADAGDADGAKALEGKLGSLQGRLGSLEGRASKKSEAFGTQAWDYAKTPLKYFGASDYKGQDGRAMAIMARGAAGGAAWMGLNAAGRVATGGGMTYNNTGERDIAGIPFI